ncbi:hypothetical protein [Streptomyces sp. NPDC006552]|uniref:hypothetical protein n=1 Tax=Streptomyces sp. NPDC006552 TaxID=3157179 RepID=UPI00339E2593
MRYTDWSAALPVVATAPRETDRWHTVAEGWAAALCVLLLRERRRLVVLVHELVADQHCFTAALQAGRPARFRVLRKRLLFGVCQPEQQW